MNNQENSNVIQFNGTYDAEYQAEIKRGVKMFPEIIHKVLGVFKETCPEASLAANIATLFQSLAAGLNGMGMTNDLLVNHVSWLKDEMLSEEEFFSVYEVKCTFETADMKLAEAKQLEVYIQVFDLLIDICPDAVLQTKMLLLFRELAMVLNREAGEMNEDLVARIRSLKESMEGEEAKES
jgi:hypothetical protein